MEKLHEVRNLTAQIKTLEERILQLRDWLCRITQELNGLPNAEGYASSRVEELTIQLADTEGELERLKLRRVDARLELIRRLDSAINHKEIKKIFVERYAFGLSFKKIAAAMNMSESNVFHLHRKGLKIYSSITVD